MHATIFPADVQSVLYRTNLFDENYAIMSPDFIGQAQKRMWLNVEVSVPYLSSYLLCMCARLRTLFAPYICS